MKKLSLLGLLAVVLFSFAFSLIDDPNPILGKWENKRTIQGAPWVLLADFKANGTFLGAVNKKVFGTGVYKVKHDTLYIYDATCDINYAGTYKIQLIGKNNDSLKFHVIQDTCTGRREGTNGYLFEKVKPSTK